MGKWIVLLVVALCSGCPELAADKTETQDVPAKTGGKEVDHENGVLEACAGDGCGPVLDAGADGEPSADGEPGGRDGGADGGMAEPAPDPEPAAPTPWWDGVWQVNRGVPNLDLSCQATITETQRWKVDADGYEAMDVERSTAFNDAALEPLRGAEFPPGSDRWKLVRPNGDVDDSWDLVMDADGLAFDGVVTLWLAEKNCYAKQTVSGKRIGDNAE